MIVSPNCMQIALGYSEIDFRRIDFSHMTIIKMKLNLRIIMQ